MENQQEYMDDLIAKSLSGEILASEQMSLDSWVAASETNRRYFGEMKKIFEAAGKMSTADVNTAWNKFRENLPAKTHTPVLRKLTIGFYSKAAAILLLIGTIGYFLSRPAAETEITLAAASPGTLIDTLPDGTLVSLNQKSAITYSSFFNTKNRELKLQGEAYFKVQHNDALPFIVNAGNVFIKDIGTAFTIKANPADSTVVVFVEEGEVVIYSAQNAGMTLTATATGIYSKASGSFRKQEAHPLADRSLKFEGVSLQSVVDTLNKTFHSHIVLSCAKLGDMKLTATFGQETVGSIVETIAETLGLSVTKTPETIVLDSDRCKN